MPYRVESAPTLGALINSWGLSDFMFVEVHLRLNEALPSGAPRNLIRAVTPFDGMVYSFERIDPENRLVNHVFLFHVVFLANEEVLRVMNGRYLRQVAV
jgi:hypothetical protein